MASGSTSRKAIFVLAANLVGAALGYLALLLIGRYVPPAGYGSYLFALGITGLFAILSNLGLGQAHQRHVAQGAHLGDALAVLTRIRLVIGAVLIAGLSVAVLALGRGHALTDATTPPVLAMAIALHALSGIRQVLLDTWQGQQRVNRVEAVKLADTLLAVALLANVALLLAHLQGRWEIVPGLGGYWAGLLGLDGPVDAEGAALLVAGCYVTAKAVTVVAAWILGLRDRIPRGRWDGDLARSYGRLAFPLALSGALILILQYTDVLLLGYFWTAREVGLYGSAQKLAGICILAATAVGTVLFPRFAQLHAAADREALRATFDKAQRWLLLAVVPVAAALVALPRQVIHVAVGDAYLDAAGPLRLLAPWALVAALEQPMSSRFMGEGRSAILVRSAGLNALANVLLNLVLVPPHLGGLGPTGAALATLVSTGLSYVYVRWQSRVHHGTAWVDAHQVRLLAAGLAAGAFWWGAAAWLGDGWFDRVWELATWGACGSALFLGVAILVGEVRMHDLDFLRRIAHPRELLAELRGR